MLFKINHRLTSAVLFELECGSMSICVEAAIKARTSLAGADLSGANLARANLAGANLAGVDLSWANLEVADLSETNLAWANLAWADLSWANLARANLAGANLTGVDLSGIKNAKHSIAQTRIVPSEGAFVGWKKLRGGVIAKVVIPHDAERVNAAGSRKCRASKVFVHEMYADDGSVFVGIGIGQRDGKTKYITGRETHADTFAPSITKECSHGIHFFITREEAEAY